MGKLQPCTRSDCNLKEIPASDVKMKDCMKCGIVSQFISLLRGDTHRTMGGVLTDQGEMDWQLQYDMDRYTAEDNEKAQEKEEMASRQTYAASRDTAPLAPAGQPAEATNPQ